MKNIHNKNTLNYFSFFIKIILFLSITSITFANENKIGSVTELNGAIVAINDKLEESNTVWWQAIQNVFESPTARLV